MTGNPKVMKVLNAQLADELTAINQVHGPLGDVRQLGLRGAPQGD